MASFRKFLTEASFKETDMPEIIKKVSSIVSKRLGQELFPWNKNGLQELQADGKTYKCYLFFLKSTKAVRFNTINGTFDSIEVWKKYRISPSNLLPKSDFTIRLDGMNIMKVIDSVVDLIDKPQEGTHKVPVNEELLMESRAADEAARMGLDNLGYGRYGRRGPDGEEHVTHKVDKVHDRLVEFEPVSQIERKRHIKDPHEWHRMAIQTFGDHKNLARLSWSDVEVIAAKHGVSIPGWVRASGTGKGKNKTFTSIPSAHLKPAQSVNDAAKAKGTDYFIKVSPRDPVTNKFSSVKDDEEGLRILATMKAHLESPSRDVMEDEMLDPNTKFGRMSDLINLVVKGVSPSLFIYGGPGIGKSFVTNKTLKDAGLKKNKDYYVIKGKITPIALYNTLYTHRNDNTMLVFDDADSVFRNEDGANMLKAALDSYEEREISWSSRNTVNVDKWTMEKREKYENQIDTRLASIGDDVPDEEEDDDVKDDDSDEDSGGKRKKKNKEKELPTKLPGKFLFNGKVIFISNLAREDVEDAILDRSYKINMDLTAQQRFKRMESLLDDIVPEVQDKELKVRVLNAIKAHFKAGTFGNSLPSMRMFESGIKIANSGMPNWTELLEYV
jgi:hypothetical protein